MNAIELPGLPDIVVIGVVATATLDVFALALQRVLGQPATNWGQVGRWVAGIGHGRFRHDHIADAPEVSGELMIGWSTHYMVGIVYAAAWLVLVAAASRSPDIWSATAFGLITVMAPWLILQPGLGAGFFASSTPNPAATRLRNLMSYVVFGLGLYLGWILRNAL